MRCACASGSSAMWPLKADALFRQSSCLHTRQILTDRRLGIDLVVSVAAQHDQLLGKGDRHQPAGPNRRRELSIDHVPDDTVAREARGGARICATGVRGKM